MTCEFIATTNNLSLMLNKLIESKSLRDNIKFTASKLAKAINANRSLISRLLTGDVEDPRIETLLKIVTFFRNDGFNIRIEDFLGLDFNAIDVRDQILQNTSSFLLPLYQMDNFNGEKIGTISAELSNPSPNTIAILSNNNIEPIFKVGSVFIVDMLKHPELGNLVIIKENNGNKLCIKKYSQTSDNKVVLYSYDEKHKIILSPSDNNYKIVGVIIRINAKT